MYATALIAVVVALEILLGISPKADRTTWALENFPVWIGVGVWAYTRKKFELSRLCLVLLVIHALILMIGGYYTYAKVPLGDWMKVWFGFSRNHYDRIGHFAQGFVPAIFVREMLLRKLRLPRSAWVPFLTISVCLAFSALYELFEWWTAVIAGDASSDFLGTQGDVWDTQSDMCMALIGATVAMLCFNRWHDRSIAAVDGTVNSALKIG